MKWIKSHSPPFGDVRNMARMMSGIWPVKIVPIPDIKNRCPGNGQFLLAVIRTSFFDVRNMDSFLCPCSGHRLLMSRMRRVRDKASFCCPYPGHQISGKIDVWNKDSDVWNKNSDVRNTDNDVRDTESDVRKMDKIPVLIPDIDI